MVSDAAGQPMKERRSATWPSLVSLCQDIFGRDPALDLRGAVLQDGDKQIWCSAFQAWLRLRSREAADVNAHRVRKELLQFMCLRQPLRSLTVLHQLGPRASTFLRDLWLEAV